MLRELGAQGDDGLPCVVSVSEAGASIYLLLKIGAAVGAPLPEIGAHTAGMTLAEFHARKAH